MSRKSASPDPMCTIHNVPIPAGTACRACVHREAARAYDQARPISDPRASYAAARKYQRRA